MVIPDYAKLPSFEFVNASRRQLDDAARYIDFTTTGPDAIRESRGHAASLTAFATVLHALHIGDEANGFCIVNHDLKHPSTLHYHDYLEVTHVISGNVLMQAGNQTMAMQTGDTMVIKPDLPHLISPLIMQHSPVEIDLAVSHRLLDWCLTDVPTAGDTTLRDWLADDSTAPGFLFVPTEQNPLFDAAVDRLVHAYCAEPMYATDYATIGALLECLSRLDDALRATPRMDALVRAVLDAITTDLQTVTLDSIAQRVGYSVGYLSRYVKSHSGKTIGQLINEARLNHAATLLRETDHTVNEIAHAVGYRSPSYLHKRFRELFLVTPKEYRRLVRESGA